MGGKHDYSKLDSIYHSFNRWIKLGFNGRIPFQPCNIPLYGKFTVFKSDLYLGAFVSNLADYIGFDIWRNFAYSCTVCSLKEKRIYQKRYILFFMAQRTGFEPAEAYDLTRFPSVRLKPLGHLCVQV